MASKREAGWGLGDPPAVSCPGGSDGERRGLGSVLSAHKGAPCGELRPGELLSGVEALWHSEDGGGPVLDSPVEAPRLTSAIRAWSGTPGVFLLLSSLGLPAARPPHALLPSIWCKTLGPCLLPSP